MARLSSVGVSGFEPEAPCSQSRCANRTALHPDCLFSERLQIKSATFLKHTEGELCDSLLNGIFCGETGIRTRGTSFPVRQFSKLLVSATHPSHLGFAEAGAKVIGVFIIPN